MIRRSKVQWLDIIQEYKTSGLPQTEFCRSKGLDPKYFSKRKAELKHAVVAAPFVAVRREVSTAMTVRVLHQDTVVTVSDCSSVWLGQLLRELA
ncbi:MAG: hypothetical protein DRR06_13600 [Gammaproteobacteria bacterium]|nr:MAG: hypothetical protein DRR06_13600 [Gammaproteobacteria bacterium]RLA47987.1 MAG: hypothetical protein DRR42_17175 [Gammaproteobacteria bacterium]